MNIETMIQHAEQHCKVHGARLTTKRKQVLSTLLQSDKALSAYELVDFCKTQYGENISAMSVYRILEFLENKGLVHKLNVAHKYIACTHIGDDHIHDVPQFLICGQCSKVKEINMHPSAIADLHTTMQNIGFKLTNPQLELHGFCDDCVTQTT